MQLGRGVVDQILRFSCKPDRHARPRCPLTLLFHRLQNIRRAHQLQFQFHDVFGLLDLLIGLYSRLKISHGRCHDQRVGIATCSQHGIAHLLRRFRIDARCAIGGGQR